MKWFKHEAKARNDERIAKLEDKAGLEGYGFYFKMLEIVSENMDASDRCETTYSLTSWGRKANISSKKAVFLLQCCHDVGLIIAQRCSDDITVKIPNLLKYRDNHTKNLQATSKQELEKELELELDKELEKELEKTKPNKTINSAKKPAEIPAVKKPEDSEKDLTNLQTACKDTWAKYANAYFTKYGALPVRNSKVNSNVKNFVQRIGAEEAPQIAAWYVNHTDNFYARDAHGFGLLAKDAEKLRTEWITGRIVNSGGFQTAGERRAANNKRAGDEFMLDSEIIIEGDFYNA